MAEDLFFASDSASCGSVVGLNGFAIRLSYRSDKARCWFFKAFYFGFVIASHRFGGCDDMEIPLSETCKMRFFLGIEVRKRARQYFLKML